MEASGEESGHDTRQFRVQSRLTDRSCKMCESRPQGNKNARGILRAAQAPVTSQREICQGGARDVLHDTGAASIIQLTLELTVRYYWM